MINLEINTAIALGLLRDPKTATNSRQMTDQDGSALIILAQLQAQTRAARAALDGLTRTADALEAHI